ncbi:unnamed protein product [Dicrocoelium dendriticum]|nr:unnamed protein product [Dicrocoelium dendriticum]
MCSRLPVGIFSRIWRPMWRPTQLFCSSSPTITKLSDHEDELVDSMDSSGAAPETPGKKYKLSQGGDINSVQILGTNIGVRFFPMSSNPTREWGVMFVRTRMRRLRFTPTDQSMEATENIKTSSCRVHIFNPVVLARAKRLRLGDRVFITGYLSYYKRPSDLIVPGDSHVPKICAVVAQRLIQMGYAPVDESSAAEDFQDML